MHARERQTRSRWAAVKAGGLLFLSGLVPVDEEGRLVGEDAADQARQVFRNMELVLKVIGQGAAQSWQMDNRGPTMVQDRFDFGFAVDWMRKDLSICLGEARKNGAQLPVTALVDQFYAEIQKMGGSRWDTSSLIARLER